MMKFLRVNRFLRVVFLPVMFGIVVTSCHKGSEKQMKEVVNGFSSAYFNWRYFEATRYVTHASCKWLSYISSQVIQTDVDSLRAMKEGATFEIGDIAYDDGGSSARVKVTVSNFLLMDSIGHSPRICSRGEYIIPLSFDGNEWKVTLSAPLRSSNIK